MSQPIDIPKKMKLCKCEICDDVCVISNIPDVYDSGRMILYEDKLTTMCFICYDRYISFLKYGYPK